MKKTLADLAARRPRSSNERRKSFAAASEETVERLAAEDGDCPELDDEQLERARASRTARKAQERSGMSRAAFAEAYRIDPLRLQDIEDGRAADDIVLVSYLKVIAADPDLVRRALSSDAP
ncbi:MAG: hypothetical protein ACK4UM_18560 [Salinarimonas sp.]